MTPKKPTMNAARRAWMQSLKPGDSVLCWAGGWNAPGWRLMTVERADPPHLQVSTIREETWGWGATFVGATTGYSTEKGKLSAVIYPPDDTMAQEGLRLDNIRRSLRKRSWFDVSDSAVERIAAILKEEQP